MKFLNVVIKISRIPEALRADAVRAVPGCWHSPRQGSGILPAEVNIYPDMIRLPSISLQTGLRASQVSHKLSKPTFKHMALCWCCVSAVPGKAEGDGAVQPEEENLQEPSSA